MSAPAVSLIHPGRVDVIVVGGGHAGAEATLAAVRMGCQVLLITTAVDRIGWMSCNPSVGGVGKTHLVAEVDALGGEIARCTDRSSVHTKLLHHTRGAAVQALRAQCDKLEYATAMRERLEGQDGLRIVQGTVSALWVEGGRIRGAITSHGVAYEATAVVLTAGTFLSAVCHVGDRQEVGGRAGEGSANALGQQLRDLGLRLLRHKTGTCPRVDGRSIDWSATDPDPGLRPPPAMARYGPPPRLPQMDCAITRTNAKSHAIIREAIPRSPLFSGQIEGTGPRYCPSIEDKVVRFGDRQGHTLFLEREGWRTQEVYVAGLSTSLPVDAQLALLRSISGLERAQIVRFGYAVEYDTIDPRQLGRDLGLEVQPGLYFAGQVNGTSGYEEAAAQGIWAGAAAACFALERDLPLLSRADAYLGVLVDDLTTRGGDEPYRMLTSRAEHRLTLRTGNADLRLLPIAEALGLVEPEQLAATRARHRRLQEAVAALEQTQLAPSAPVLRRLADHGQGSFGAPASLAELLRRPGMTFEALRPYLPPVLASARSAAASADAGAGANAFEAAQVGPNDLEGTTGTTSADLDALDLEEVQIEIRYQAYHRREQGRITRTRRAESVALPADLDFDAIGALSAEARQRLRAARPATLGAAARLPGLTPTAVQALYLHLELRRRAASAVGDGP